MSLRMPSSASAELLTIVRYSRCSATSGVSSASSVMPMMPFSGVRISWLMFARNSLFAWLASSATRVAAASSAVRSRTLRSRSSVSARSSVLSRSRWTSACSSCWYESREPRLHPVDVFEQRGDLGRRIRRRAAPRPGRRAPRCCARSSTSFLERPRHGARERARAEHGAAERQQHQHQRERVVAGRLQAQIQQRLLDEDLPAGRRDRPPIATSCGRARRRRRRAAGSGTRRLRPRAARGPADRPARGSAARVKPVCAARVDDAIVLIDDR